MNKSRLSQKLKFNWLIDALLFIAALAAILTGIYFLVLPQGGFMGGRNPYYGIVILFERETWEWLHEWTGIAMIAAILIHLLFHWRWVLGTIKRVVNGFARGAERLGDRLRWTIIIDVLIAIGFIVSLISGLVFFFGLRVDPLLSKSTWDMLHTWGSIVLIMASLIHFLLHWSWIKNITAKMVRRYARPVPQKSTPAIPVEMES